MATFGSIFRGPKQFTTSSQSDNESTRSDDDNHSSRSDDDKEQDSLNNNDSENDDNPSPTNTMVTDNPTNNNGDNTTPPTNDDDTWNTDYTQASENPKNIVKPMGYSLSVRETIPIPGWGHKHAYWRALTRTVLRKVCRFMDKNIRWRNILDKDIAKFFALPYAQLSALNKKGKSKGFGMECAVLLPAELHDKLGDATSTVAPSTDNVYTFGPDMPDAAFRKGQDMLRLLAGNKAVDHLHEIMEVMESYGMESDTSKEDIHQQAARRILADLRDALIKKLSEQPAAVAAAGQVAMAPAAGSATGTAPMVLSPG